MAEVRFRTRPPVRPEYEGLRRYGLFEGVVFGPVRSRRLGASLGVNPLPSDEKICSFDCPYCECGRTVRTMDWMLREAKFPSVEEIGAALDAALGRLRDRPPDAITLTGNGEPTMHPDFPGVVEVVQALRAKHAPGARTVLLTNGTLLGNPAVREAAASLDEVEVKLDAGTERTMREVDLPLVSWTPERVARTLAGFPRGRARLVVQTIFLDGAIRNATDEEVAAWCARLREIRPDAVVIYTLDRVPDAPGLAPVAPERLRAIARRAEEETGCPVRVS